MLEAAKSLVDSLILAWPKFFVMGAVAIGAISGGFAAWKYLHELQTRRGSISGRIVLEDGSDPSISSLSFSLGSKQVVQIEPEHDGTFSTVLKQGNYALTIEAQGYVTQNTQVSVLRGALALADITMHVSAKPVKLRLADKSGQPYANVAVALMKGIPPGPSTNYTTDANGELRTATLTFGDFNLSPAKPTAIQNAFLWCTEGRNYMGHFQLSANRDSYDLVLPRVLYSELSGSSSAFRVSPTNERFIAQSFSINSALKFCGVGFGAGFGNTPPTTLQVRKDRGGEPGSEIIFRATVGPFTGAISTGSEAPYADFCEATAPRAINPGIYWVVAEYDQVPSAIHVLGGNASPLNGSQLKSSADGTIWREATPLLQWKMLDLFIVE